MSRTRFSTHKVRPGTLPQIEKKAAFVREMFDDISPRYDLMNRIMTGRMDQKWRKYAVSTLNLNRTDLVLDIACGTGDFVQLLQNSNYSIGVDFSLGMLIHSKQPNLIQSDANRLPFKDRSFDAITCGFALRNFTRLDVVFAEMARLVKPKGKIAIVEVSRPANPVINRFHSIYFDHIIPLMGSMIAKKRAYSYLSASTAYLPDEDKLRDALVEAGFIDIHFKYFLMGSSQVISATKGT